jgi:hypothetical protein
MNAIPLAWGKALPPHLNTRLRINPMVHKYIGKRRGNLPAGYPLGDPHRVTPENSTEEERDSIDKYTKHHS